MKIQKQIQILEIILNDLKSIEYIIDEHTESSIKTRLESFLLSLEDKERSKLWAEKLKKIRWSPQIYFDGMPDSYFKEEWEYGKRKTIELVEVIINEIRLYNDEGSVLERDEKSIIFISHSSKDKVYGNALVNLLEEIIIDDSEIVYTSSNKHKIPLGENIYDYLKNRINKQTIMIFLLSDNLMSSPPCMNEMGAAWGVGSKTINVFCPGFNENDERYQKCAIDQKSIYMKIEDENSCKSRLYDLIQIIYDSNFSTRDLNAESRAIIIDDFIDAVKR